MTAFDYYLSGLIMLTCAIRWAVECIQGDGIWWQVFSGLGAIGALILSVKLVRAA